MDNAKITYFGLPPNSDRSSGYSKWFFPVYDEIVSDGVFESSLLNYNDKVLNERSGRLMVLALPYLAYRLNGELTDGRNIVHVLRQNSWFKEIFTACKLLSKYRVVKVVTVHDIMNEDGTVDTRIGRYLEEVDAIFCPSLYTKNSLTMNFEVECPIYVTYNPLDQRYFKLKEGPGGNGCDSDPARGLDNGMVKSKIVINISSEMGRKNIEQLLRVVHEMNKVEPTTLIKVGRPTKNREKYLSLAKELGIQDRIRWVDWASEDDLMRYYQCSDLFLTLSEGEGFCMPLIEAMACGVPVVAAKATAIPEIVGEAGLLVDPSDLDAVVEKCQMVLNDQALVERLKNKGRERSRTFQSKSVAKRYLDAYADLLK